MFTVWPALALMVFGLKKKLPDSMLTLRATVTTALVSASMFGVVMDASVVVVAEASLVVLVFVFVSVVVSPSAFSSASASALIVVDSVVLSAVVDVEVVAVHPAPIRPTRARVESSKFAFFIRVLGYVTISIA